MGGGHSHHAHHDQCYYKCEDALNKANLNTTYHFNLCYNNCQSVIHYNPPSSCQRFVSAHETGDAKACNIGTQQGIVLQGQNIEF